MNTMTTPVPTHLGPLARDDKAAAPVRPPGAPALLRGWRPRSGDLRAAWVSSIVMVPQAVAFAVIAGLPPEMGLYASVVPVIVAALLGASPRLLSGPNTAVSVMIAAALLPLAAPGGCDYLALVAVLSVMVGVTQLVFAACGAGGLLALLPPFVSHGLTAGIGFVMIGSQLAPATGVLSLPEASPWLSAWSVLIDHAAMNPFSITVAVSALVAGHLCGRYRVPGLPPLVAAMVGGSLMAWLLDLLFGAAVANIDRIGHLQVLLLPWSMPDLRWHEWFVIKQLAYSAVAIAVVGGLQTVVISRAVCGDDPRAQNPRRELLAQGMANLSAAFTGGFAGSGSFNRTAAHVKAGAETRLAGVLSSVLLLLLAWLAGPLFAYIALPAVAGTIALIGWGMLRSGLQAIWPDRGFARVAALCTVVAALLIGVESSLTLVALLGFLSLVLAHRTPVAVKDQP
ncbi:SulP family inorganic anion transporter [Ideonella sp.]|uniref:SulP family inorganic anion transporter n=1 Tax=Ideonella sp. TaxID=1929293 RepID=UPI0035AE83BF